LGSIPFRGESVKEVNMKIVVVESKEEDGGSLAVLVPEKALWAFQVLCARAGQKVKAITDEEKIWNKDFTLRKEEVHEVTV
jgi:hypothetical protein